MYHIPIQSLCHPSHSELWEWGQLPLGPAVATFTHHLNQTGQVSTLTWYFFRKESSGGYERSLYKTRNVSGVQHNIWNIQTTCTFSQEAMPVAICKYRHHSNDIVLQQTRSAQCYSKAWAAEAQYLQLHRPSHYFSLLLLCTSDCFLVPGTHSVALTPGSTQFHLQSDFPHMDVCIVHWEITVM